ALHLAAAGALAGALTAATAVRTAAGALAALGCRGDAISGAAALSGDRAARLALHVAGTGHRGDGHIPVLRVGVAVARLRVVGLALRPLAALALAPLAPVGRILPAVATLAVAGAVAGRVEQPGQA